MSVKQTTEKNKSTTKKSLLSEVVLQISKAVPTLRATLGEKKFDKRIKKAAKLLIDGIKATEPKKEVVTKPSPIVVPTTDKKAAAPKKKATAVVPAKKIVKR